MSKELVILRITHRHGEEIWAYDAAEEAFDRVVQWARDNWAMNGPDSEMPEDHDDMVEEYFEAAEERWSINTVRHEPKPVRVVIDMSGGLFHGATSDGPVEIMVVDAEDEDHPRAHVPDYPGPNNRPIWAEIQSASVDPEHVCAAFNGATWLPNEEQIDQLLETPR